MAALQKEYYDARHVCYAYMLGPERLEWRANDNGEPSGTAGKPILGQINSAGLTDILICVVRYFGGVKLGTSGLIEAYREAGTFDDSDPIGVLDVTISSNLILDKLLGIKDLRRDKRIDFVGGIRGLGELKKRVDSGEMKMALALYPVSMKQLMDIADTGNIMPPKTTWFEPKLRSGLVIHSLD